jgi:hypothetical protein
VNPPHQEQKLTATKWLPQPEIDFACADISFKWPNGNNAALTVVMHFSLVRNGFDKDLELTFLRPIAIAWEDEFFGLIESPDVLPKCTCEKAKGYTHPTLVIEGSRWRRSYADRKYRANDPQSKAMTHYFLVSMNDLLHVLVEAPPESKWITPIGA